MKKAIIIGVGPINGLGTALAERFASNNLEVFISGRTESNLKKTQSYLNDKGYIVKPIVADATKEKQLENLFKEVGKGLDLAIYNVGNNMPGKIIEMESDYFKTCWEQCCFGAFLFSKIAVRTFLSERTEGTLLFTGASASLRGKSNFGAFNSAKGALRNLAQALAKEYAENSIHVSHVIVDGGLAGERIKQRLSDFEERVKEGKLINIENVTDAYMFLYNQSKDAWTFELDVRTSQENW